LAKSSSLSRHSTSIGNCQCNLVLLLPGRWMVDQTFGLTKLKTTRRAGAVNWSAQRRRLSLTCSKWRNFQSLQLSQSLSSDAPHLRILQSHSVPRSPSPKHQRAQDLFWDLLSTPRKLSFTANLPHLSNFCGLKTSSQSLTTTWDLWSSFLALALCRMSAPTSFWSIPSTLSDTWCLTKTTKHPLTVHLSLQTSKFQMSQWLKLNCTMQD